MVLELYATSSNSLASKRPFVSEARVKGCSTAADYNLNGRTGQGKRRRHYEPNVGLLKTQNPTFKTVQDADKFANFDGMIDSEKFKPGSKGMDGATFMKSLGQSIRRSTDALEASKTFAQHQGAVNDVRDWLREVIGARKMENFD